MYDVITIGSALTDIFISSNQFTVQDRAGSALLCQVYGDKIEVDDFEIHTGGGGSNTAVGFARQGFRTAVISEIGKDTLATVILEDFHKEKVATNLLVQEKREKTGGSVILIGADGGRTVMVHRGASSQLDAEDISVSHLKQAEWIHLSSISGRRDALQAIGKALDNTQKLSWNPGKAELQLLADEKIAIEDMHCQILLLNKEEWSIVSSIQQTIKHHVPEIIVTNGKKGGFVLHEGEEKPFSSSAVKSIDDTGAGDAFGVGYVTSRIKGRNIEESTDYAIQNASAVIQAIGAKKGLLFGT